MPHDLVQIAQVDSLPTRGAVVETITLIGEIRSAHLAWYGLAKVRQLRPFCGVWSIIRPGQAVLVNGGLLFVDHSEKWSFRTLGETLL